MIHVSNAPAHTGHGTGPVGPPPQTLGSAPDRGPHNVPQVLPFPAPPLSGGRHLPAAEHDPHGTDPHALGAKLDGGKPRPWLCFSGFARALGAVAEVTTIGAQKYTPRGWESVPDGAERYMDAALRHLLALGRGEDLDRDTGCAHKAQAVWNLLASLELELRGVAPVSIRAAPPAVPSPWKKRTSMND